MLSRIADALRRQFVRRDVDSRPWRLPPGGIAARLFITAWLVYGLHFAPDIVREIYPALALGDHLSFRVDEYGELHPDLFEKEGYGWHIGNNPGASMMAAVPYVLARPAIDAVVSGVRERRAAAGLEAAPEYDSSWPNERRFFRQAWERGLDVKLALGALVMQLFFMAPVCALSAVVMFYLLRRLLRSDAEAMWLALLYAFGTPVFYRAAFLNHNMLLGIFAFMAFFAMWDPGGRLALSRRSRALLGGLAGGTAVLFDYSGAVFLLGLFAYGLWKTASERSNRAALAYGGSYVAGSLGPILLLWFYQWRSFGHPFYPGQHWMPPVRWIEQGYQGYGGPQLELLWALALDHRFGLFVFCPLLLLALAAPWAARRRRGEEGSPAADPGRLPTRELAFTLVLFVALWVFFSGSNYTRLQFNTGMRYMSPIVPFLFLPAALVLRRLPRALAWAVGGASVALTWCLSMYREVERPLGVLDPVIRTLVGGFELPVLSSLEKTGGAYLEFVADGTSPLPLFLLVGVTVWAVWRLSRAGVAETRGGRGEGG